MRFLARARGYTMFLSPTEAVIKLRHEDVAPRQADASRRIERSAATIEAPAVAQNGSEPLTLRMTIVGAQPAPRMTGEVTLQGRVLPIGGLKQKVLAAHAAGLTEVIVPERNEPDLDDVPSEVRSQIRFHLVGSVDQVLTLALEPPGLAMAA